MQIKTTIQQNFTLVKMVIIKKGGRKQCEKVREKQVLANVEKLGKSCTFLVGM